MISSTFSEISKDYEKTSIIQKGASETLFDLLQIKSSEDVLDLGCGPGHLTEKIKEITKGGVIGIDPYKGMISQAKDGIIDLTVNRIFLMAEKQCEEHVPCQGLTPHFSLL